ncbi:hypothetical protein P7C73_g3945, partial [Tremellales sp. Uapishka_1]
MSYQPGTGTGGSSKLHKTQQRVSSSSSLHSKSVDLPEDLEKVLTVLSNGILQGHLKLAAALRRRYENQYPLVRSLADVFISHSYILREYATYVLHLERALAQADEALETVAECKLPGNKRASRRLEETDMGRLGKVLARLENMAAEKGESGLVISLSKPFQRLLKYPLLFQNLLFNTDPSTKEYEATLAMVDEVEMIVRSIEDEKASSEEREKTRDVWARIEGLERDKVLMTPKPNRLLISEVSLALPETDKEAIVKQKKSFKRLSDILKGHPEHSDPWVVRFSDVSLLCEKIGVTHLPLSTIKSESMSDMSGKTRHGTMGRRSQSIRARNLYRFVRVHEWHLKHKTGSQEGLLSMEDISRARQITDPSPSALCSIPASPITTPHRTPTKVPLNDTSDSPTKSTPRSRRTTTTDTDTVVSDRVSVMSFAFKGSDQVRPATTRVQRRTSGGHLSGSAANAKFANRLRSPDLGVAGDVTIRPASRARRSLPPEMIRSANTNIPLPGKERPAWNASTSASSPSVKSGAAPSIRSTASRRIVPSSASTAPTKRLPTSPSEDSGVAGLWQAYQVDSARVGETPVKTVRARPVRALGGRI